MSDQNDQVDVESDVRFTNDEVNALAALAGATLMAEPDFLAVLAGDPGTASAVRKLAESQEGEVVGELLAGGLDAAEVLRSLADADTDVEEPEEEVL